MASVNIPNGQTAVKVQIIDTKARITGPCAAFMEPFIPGHEQLSAPAYIFVVEHENSQRKLLFDLGIRQNIDEYSPALRAKLKHFQVESGEEAFDFLRSRGVDLDTIEAIIWSHPHVDHIGNPAGFPSSTALVVGPGFKTRMLPGYPKNPDAEILESDYEGRQLREIDFEKESNGITIGGFRAVDYFEDGSFYLLETPGHTLDHMAGFARTSVSPPNFIFMGGDIGHHASQWRPTELIPLPAELTPSPLGANSILNVRQDVCPCSLFTEHVHPEHSNSTPFYRIKKGLTYDPEMAQDTLRKLYAFDADDKILVITAHDDTLHPILDYWPKVANGWYNANWKGPSRWRFLKDFSKSVEQKVLV